MADEKGVFKRCGCTEPVLDVRGRPMLNSKGRPKRRELGSRCPKLSQRGHGTWWFQVDAAPIPGRRQERRRVRRGGFDTKTAALTERSKIIGMGARARTRRVPNDQVTVAEFLDRWIATRRKLKRKTLVSYRGHIEKYLKPYLGQIPLVTLSMTDVREAFDAIEDLNEEIRHRRASQRKREPGGKRPANYERRRPMSAASMQRLRATARSAWNSELAAELGVTSNPFAALELDSGALLPPLLWTAERVAHWRATGEVPDRVMVWTPAQFGEWLDFAYVEAPTWARLFELIGNTGMRRGESCGLRWREDLDAGRTRLQLEEQLDYVGGKLLPTTLKSEHSKRRIPLSPLMRKLILEHEREQERAKAQWGSAWVDSGRMFTQADGSALRPMMLTLQFKRLVAASGMPPVSLHGLRHCAATTGLAAGVDMKVIQELLGHTRLSTTADLYASVVEELQHEAVAKISKAIPRNRTIERATTRTAGTAPNRNRTAASMISRGRGRPETAGQGGDMQRPGATGARHSLTSSKLGTPRWASRRR